MLAPLRFLCLAASFAVSASVSAAGLDSLTNSETVTGLKDALVRGADIAVSQLGQKDGYLDNKRVRIPLPEPLQSAEKAMRAMGMKKQAEELIAVYDASGDAKGAFDEITQRLVTVLAGISEREDRETSSASTTAATSKPVASLTEPAGRTGGIELF